MAREIQISRGKIVLVDDEDYELLAAHSWTARPKHKGREKWYAQRTASVDGRKTTILMHRVIMAAPKGLDVDHADGDGLNNRKGNLRICTRALNCANTWHPTAQSGFRGVYPKKRLWRAELQVNGVRYRAGTFVDPAEAARAYDAAALIHFGEFARLNFPGEVATRRDGRAP